MRGFGGGMGGLMAQAQKMQAELAKAQEEIKTMTAEATAGGGMVKVKVSGKRELKEIIIDPQVVDPEDIEMLQDLIMAAVNEALRQADEAMNNSMNSLTGGLNIPGLL